MAAEAFDARTFVAFISTRCTCVGSGSGEGRGDAGVEVGETRWLLAVHKAELCRKHVGGSCYFIREVTAAVFKVTESYSSAVTKVRLVSELHTGCAAASLVSELR